MEQYLDQEIENLQNSGQISPCKYSLWNTVIFMVKKPNGENRLVVDARAINSEIISDLYPLPKINHIFDKMTENCYWSSFDLPSSFAPI